MNAIAEKRPPIPEWMRKRVHHNATQDATGQILDKLSLNTICRESRCPNWGECWSQGHATFLILGDICTRNCGFCSVKTGKPGALDSTEPSRVARAVKEMGVRYAVITSVDRDDLPDLGSEAFAQTIRSVRDLSPEVLIEVLIPDFKADPSALERIVGAKPEVLAHNLETVPSLNKQVRPQASYERSLEVFKIVKALAPGQITKSGLMLGLGETSDEVVRVMKDLRNAGCDLLSVGQYLYPGGDCLPVQRYAHPEEFAEYERIALELGFAGVMSAPYVRTSYRAKDLYTSALQKGNSIRA